MTYKGRNTIYQSENDEPDWLGHKHGNVGVIPPRARGRAANTLRNKRIKAEKIKTYLKTSIWFLILVAAVLYIFIDFSSIGKDNIQ